MDTDHSFAVVFGWYRGIIVYKFSVLLGCPFPGPCLNLFRFLFLDLNLLDLHFRGASLSVPIGVFSFWPLPLQVWGLRCKKTTQGAHRCRPSGPKGASLCAVFSPPSRVFLRLRYTQYPGFLVILSWRTRKGTFTPPCWKQKSLRMLSPVEIFPPATRVGLG